MNRFPLRKVTDVELAFPACEWFPDFDEVPSEYKSVNGRTENSGHPAVAFISQIVHGSRNATEMKALPRRKVEWSDGSHAEPDPEQAWRVICCVVGSFGLKHEHKLAIAGWLVERRRAAGHVCGMSYRDRCAIHSPTCTRSSKACMPLSRASRVAGGMSSSRSLSSSTSAQPHRW